MITTGGRFVCLRTDVERGENVGPGVRDETRYRRGIPQDILLATEFLESIETWADVAARHCEPFSVDRFHHRKTVLEVVATCSRLTSRSLGA